MLVLLGVRLDGTKELIALAEGLRESTESWADLLRDCRRRGMRDPERVVGDGAMGLWKALYNAEDRTHAEKAIEAFAKTYGTKWPKAAAKITDDRDELLAYLTPVSSNAGHCRLLGIGHARLQRLQPDPAPGRRRWRPPGDSPRN